MKSELEKLLAAADKGPKFDRKSFDEMLVRKFFVVPSFEIHGGVGEGGATRASRRTTAVVEGRMGLEKRQHIA